MSKPYNLQWRRKKRRQSALGRLEKRIEALSKSKSAEDSARLKKSQEEAVNLIKHIGSI